MVKLPEENREKMILDIGLDNDIFGYDTKSAGNKSKKRQVGVYQKASAQQRKESTEENKQPMGWGKTFANHLSDKW